MQMPAMDLRGCLRLKAVNFDHIVPDALELPLGCTAHISSCAELCLKAWDSWHSVHSGIIDTSRSPFGPGAFSQLLRRPHLNMTSLKLVMSHYSRSLDFSTAFPCLKHLDVRSTWIHSITIPDSLSSWRMHVRHCECIHIADPRVSAESLSNLDLAYNDFTNCSDVNESLGAMNSLGKACSIAFEDPPEELLWIQKTVVFGEQLVHTCPCRACGPCLSHEGSMDPSLVHLHPI